MIGNILNILRTFYKLFIIIFYIATQAYQDLVAIIKHSDFNPGDIIENIRWFKTW